MNKLSEFRNAVWMDVNVMKFFGCRSVDHQRKKMISSQNKKIVLISDAFICNRHRRWCFLSICRFRILVYFSSALRVVAPRAQSTMADYNNNQIPFKLHQSTWFGQKRNEKVEAESNEWRRRRRESGKRRWKNMWNLNFGRENVKNCFWHNEIRASFKLLTKCKEFSCFVLCIGSKLVNDRGIRATTTTTATNTRERNMKKKKTPRSEEKWKESSEKCVSVIWSKLSLEAILSRNEWNTLIPHWVVRWWKCICTTRCSAFVIRRNTMSHERNDEKQKNRRRTSKCCVALRHSVHLN